MAGIVDNSVALPDDVGELDDPTEFCDAFWQHVTRTAPAFRPWPSDGDFLEQAIEPACPTSGACYLRLDLLGQRCVMELARRSDDGALRGRVLLAAEIDVPRAPTTAMDDPRRVAQFHLGFRAEQYAGSVHCFWQPPRAFFGRLKGLRDLAEQLRGSHLTPRAREATKSYDAKVHAAWAAQAARSPRHLAVQPDNILDCGAYRRQLAAIGYPPHVVVLRRAPGSREPEELLNFPIDDAAAIVDVYLDLFHEYPTAAFWLTLVATRGAEPYSFAVAPAAPGAWPPPPPPPPGGA